MSTLPSPLRIHTFRDAVVRARAQDIPDPYHPSIRALIPAMAKLMHVLNGIGIAGNQVGEPRRLFVYASQDGDVALINPRIVRRSLRTETAEEGCLSVPGVFGLVKRYRAVEVAARLPDGKAIRIHAKGLLARVLQHELDHLQGTLFIDRATRFTTANAHDILAYRRKPSR